MRVLESPTLEVYRSGIHEHAAIAEAYRPPRRRAGCPRMREHLQNDYGPLPLLELTGAAALKNKISPQRVSNAAAGNVFLQPRLRSGRFR